MKRVSGSNVKVSIDSTGGIVSVDWDCPYCGMYNAGFYGSSQPDAPTGDFEMDQRCDYCGKLVTIECRNPEKLFP